MNNLINSKINELQKYHITDNFTILRYKQFLKYMPKIDNLKILDFGCCTGKGGFELKKNSPKCKIYGANIVSKRLNDIPSGIYNKIFDLNKFNLEIELENIDIIVLGEVIEHIALSELINLLLFKKILKPNGIILMTTPNPKSIMVRMGSKNVFNDPSHINLMELKFIKTILKKLNFKEIKIKGSGKMIKYIGDSIPFIDIYNSYLIIVKNTIQKK